MKRSRRVGISNGAVVLITVMLSKPPVWGQVQNLTLFQPPVANGEMVNSSFACYLNEAGVVAANANVLQAGGLTRRVSYSLKGDQYQILGELPGHGFPVASAINAQGDVVGTMQDQTSLRRVIVMWTNGTPRVLPLPPPPNVANYWLPSPVALDERGRVLVYLTEMNPANQPLNNAKAYLMDENQLTELPAIAPGGPVSAVHNHFFLDIRPSGQLLGSALVTRLGQSRTIGFLYQNGSFTEILVDDLFQVIGMNGRGEVLCRRFDGNLAVWRNGQVTPLSLVMPPEQIQNLSSWNAKGQTCGSIRMVRNTPGNWTLNAVLSFSPVAAR
jgi:hypothetical protein